MAIADIKAFSEKAKTDAELKEKLKACLKLREILNLAKEYGFELDEVEFNQHCWFLMTASLLKGWQ